MKQERANSPIYNKGCKTLYIRRWLINLKFSEHVLHMRTSFSLLASVATIAVLGVGCAGPEQKLGRGINNITEFARGGEIRRSMEQTALFNGPDVAYTTGFLHGFNRSLTRTAVGAYEIITAPFPPYEPVFFPVNPVYPESFKPRILADQAFTTDANLGFGGGDVAPMIPGSRFSIFENQ
jgi:putative exosortase-associated protein (TIGR04073 family)